MPRGGARVRSGPPADPNAVRRAKDHLEFTELSEPRRGVAPPWPLSPRLTTRERWHWRRLWRRREAVQWEVLGLEVEVAIHVRTLAAVEPGASAAMLSELHRQMDALGLTAAGRRSLRWIEQTNPVARADREPAKAARSGTPARWKPEVIDGTG